MFLLYPYLQVFDAIGDKEKTEELAKELQHDMEKNAVVEFHSPTVAVRESIGRFPVTIWRHGNVVNQVSVR